MKIINHACRYIKGGWKLDHPQKNCILAECDQNTNCLHLGCMRAVQSTVLHAWSGTLFWSSVEY